MIPRIWQSGIRYAVGYSEIFINSEALNLKTETLLRSTILSVKYNRKTYDNYSNSSFSFELEKPFNKLEYAVPMLFDLSYQHHYRLWREYFFVTPFISYSKGFFINLVFFGKGINVLPYTTIWSGLSLSLNTRIMISLKYSMALMGSVNYSGISAPVTGKKMNISADLRIYNRWGLRGTLESFTIETTLGKTFNQFQKVTFNVIYAI